MIPSICARLRIHPPLRLRPSGWRLGSIGFPVFVNLMNSNLKGRNVHIESRPNEDFAMSSIAMVWSELAVCCLGFGDDDGAITYSGRQHR